MYNVCICSIYMCMCIYINICLSIYKITRYIKVAPAKYWKLSN